MKNVLLVLSAGLLVSACTHVDRHYHYNSNNRPQTYQKYEEYRYKRNTPSYSRTVCQYETFYDAYGRRSSRQVCRTR